MRCLLRASGSMFSVLPLLRVKQVEYKSSIRNFSFVLRCCWEVSVSKPAHSRLWKARLFGPSGMTQNDAKVGRALQAHMSDMTAADCLQAFPMYPNMSAHKKGSMQPDPPNSLDQAEPLHADTSPMHQVNSCLSCYGWCLLLPSRRLYHDPLTHLSAIRSVVLFYMAFISGSVYKVCASMRKMRLTGTLLASGLVLCDRKAVPM